MSDAPPRHGRQGGRWINERPGAEEFAEWFTVSMRLDPALRHEDYIGGVVLIPGIDSKAPYVTGFTDRGLPIIERREELSYVPYAKVETRTAYWWDLLEAHPEWLGVVEHVTSPRIPLDFVTETETRQGEDDVTVRIERRQPGAMTMLVHQLPEGFSIMSVPVAEGYSHFICCTIRVAIFTRETLESTDRAPVPLRTGRGTKQVPLLAGRNPPYADASSLMKAETGALGRALGFAGVFVIPGSGVACLPTRAEILTRRGWRHHDQIEVGEDVLAYDHVGDRNRWTPLRRISVYDDAPLCRLRAGKNFEAVCTPDHKWAVRKKHRGTEVPQRELREALDLRRGEPEIILAAVAEEGSLGVSPRDAAVMGWLMSDGWLGYETDSRDGRVSLRATITQSKAPYVAEIRALLGTDASESDRAPGTHNLRRGGTVTGRLVNHAFRLSAAYLRHLIVAFGVRDRADVPAVLSGLSAPARAAMLDAMLKADGSRRGSGWVFTKGRRDALDAFQILATLEGYRLGRERPMVHSRSVHQAMSRSRSVGPGRRLRVEPEFPGRVWCPTTDYGTWVARLDGRVFITGNTAEDMLEALAQGPTPVESAPGNQGPASPAAPPVRTGAERIADDEQALRARAQKLYAALSEEQPKRAEEFGAWARERRLQSFGEAHGAMLRGAVKKLERLSEPPEEPQAAPEQRHEEVSADVPAQAAVETAPATDD